MLIAYFLGNISAKYYENPTMLSRVILKTSGMFFETQCSASRNPIDGFLSDLHHIRDLTVKIFFRRSNGEVWRTEIFQISSKNNR